MTFGQVVGWSEQLWVRSQPGLGGFVSLLRLWPPDPDSSRREGARSQTQVPPPQPWASSQVFEPPRSGCDEKEPPRENRQRSVAVVEASGKES